MPSLTRRAATRSRGFFGIGIERGKTVANVGTLWRSAFSFNAAWIFTIGPRYPKQASDTLKTWRHIPLVSFTDLDAFYAALPCDCQLVGIELDERAKTLSAFSHPQRAVYLLGAEDHGLSREARVRCHHLIQLPGRYCLNVAVAGAIVMCHRVIQMARSEQEPI